MDEESSAFGAEPEQLDKLLAWPLGEDMEEDKPTGSLEQFAEGPGSRIGRYKLLSTLGEGGMGVVYLSEQKQPIIRKVALKVIKPGMDSKQVLARFEAERQALALLDHPNIARVYDAGTTEAGRPYFVMEYVKGVPITEHSDRYKLTINERLQLFLQVCAAVQHAHQKGIIHRDLKPSNVQVAIQGEQVMPKVIDFGVAKAVGQPLTQSTLVTEQGHFIGTPEYMSPEQAEMTGQDVDTRSDIYSLGVLLYELLTGFLPFDSQIFREGGIDRIRHMIREEEPKTPSTRLSTLSGQESAKLAQMRRTDARTLGRLLHGDLDWITLRAMEKDPMRRYQTAYALAEDIQRYINQEPVLAGPPSMAYKMRKFVLRNKSLVSSVAVIALILVLATVTSLSQMVRANRAVRKQRAVSKQLGIEKKRAEDAEGIATKQRVRAEEQELHARQMGYASDMNLIVQALSINDMGRARTLLDRHRPLSSGSNDLRGWEWRYLWKQCRSDGRFFCQAPDCINSLSVSHDGRWLASGTYFLNNEITVWDMQKRQPMATLTGHVGAISSQVAFSPKDPLLAFRFSMPSTGSSSPVVDSNDAIQLWNVERREMEGELPLKGHIKGFTFSTDGAHLVGVSTTGITIWRMTDLQAITHYPLDSEPKWTRCKTLALSHDMSFLAIAADKGIHIVDLDTGTARRPILTSANTVALSPDAKVLASNSPGSIRLWDVASGEEIGQLEGHRAWVSDLLFLPGAKTLISASSDQTIRLWDVSDPSDARLITILRGHTTEVWNVALLPDQKTLISGDERGTVYTWDIEDLPNRPGPMTLENIVAFGFFPLGSQLLTLESNGRVSQWEAPDYREERVLFHTNERAPHQVFSNDCAKLVTWSARDVSQTQDTINVWDVPRGRLLESFSCPKSSHPVAFLKQGKELVTVCQSNDSHDIWDLGTGQHVASWPGAEKLFGDQNNPGISHDDRWCLTVAIQGGETTLRDLTSGDERQLKLDISMPFDTIFSPNNTLFAIASRRGLVKLWEFETMRELAAHRQFLHGTHSVAFSRDGRRLAVGGSGVESIKIFDVDSHQHLLTLESTGNGCSQTAFSPDGNALATADYYGKFFLWHAPSLEEIKEAEALSLQADTY